MKKINIIYHVIKVPLILLLIFISYKLLIQEKKIQKIKLHNAYQNDASRGIFNVNEWRCRLVDLVEKKIEKTDLRKLSKLITKEIVKYYRNKTEDIRKKDVLEYNSKHSFLDNIGGLVSRSYTKLKTKGIDYAIRKGTNFITKKIGENNEKLQKIISQKTTEFIKKSLEGDREANSFNDDCKPKEIVLKSTKNIESKQSKLFLQYWVLFFIMITIIFILYYKEAPQSPKGEVNSFKKWLLIDASLIAIILLVLGIMLPMMEINATLLDLKFKLLNEDIIFANQSLYFRSKSIYDIVVILLPVNPLIGVAVMVFSVVLPSFKLIATFILLYSKKPSKKLKWFIANLGKWSMADVFLIAIFLANLSFQNILSEQLQPLNQSGKVEMAVNTSNSNIQIGFYFFFGYVILSMIIAKLTVGYLKGKNNKTNT